MRCPDAASLRAFAEGELQDAALEAHLEECERCLELLAEGSAEAAGLDDLKDHWDTLTSARKPRESAPPGYVLLRVLNRGGQAIVYEARQVGVERPVALKILRYPESERDRSRADRELELSRNLKHPGIVHLYDSGVHEERRWLAMELIRGSHLDDWLRTHPRALRHRVTLILELSRAVHHAHQRGVIHRDIKPSNVIVDEESTIHLLDFGAAKAHVLAERAERELTRTGEFAGTLPWAAPEQVTGRPGSIDIRTDVHALGLCLHLTLTGAAPRGQGDSSLAELVSAITTRNLDPPSQGMPAGEGDLELDRIVARATALDPEQRYASAEAFGRDLERWLVGDPVEAVEGGSWYTLRKALRRHRRVVAAAAAAWLLLTVAILAVLHFWSEARTDARRAEEALAERAGLADALAVEQLLGEADLLWPQDRHLARRAAPWIARTERLLGRREGHHRALERLSEERPEPDASLPSDATWFRLQIAQLLRGLERLETTRQAIEARVLQAEAIVRRSCIEPSTIWTTAAEQLHAELGFRLPPQCALVPLWHNRRTGCWEFWVLGTGERPRFDPEREEWRPGPDGALIMVLVPGGRMRNPEQAAPIELDPFFIAKYELTLGQWERMSQRPLEHAPVPAGVDPATPEHPATDISWHGAHAMLRQLGLELPTRSQWLWAARAGARTRFHPGARPEDLAGFANVLDGGEHDGLELLLRPLDAKTYGLRDPHPWTAPVGSYAANAYGLYDIHGNVAEWCRDGGRQPLPPRRGDGWQRPRGGDSAREGDASRRILGGSCRDEAPATGFDRSSLALAESTSPVIGLRPVRVVRD